MNEFNSSDAGDGIVLLCGVSTMLGDAVHEIASRPLAQFDLILAWASWKLLWAT